MAAAEDETRNTGGAAPWLITAWFIWTFLFISTVIGAVVVFRVDHGSWEGTDRAVLRVGTIGIIASVLAWVSYETPAFFRRGTRGLVGSANARYFVSFLVSMFLAWSVFWLGQVCAFWGLPLLPVVPVFFGATWLLFVFHFPTRAKAIRWADDSAASVEVDSVETERSASMTVTAGGALRQFFSVMKARWLVLLMVGGACVFPTAVIGFFLLGRLTKLETLGYMDTNIGTLASIPFSAIAAGTVVLLVMDALRLREEDIASSFSSSFRRLPSLIAATALIWIATSIGFLLLVVPGIILSIRLYLTVPALMVEEIGPLEALRRAWTLSRTHQLAIFFAGFIVWLIVFPLVISPMLPFIDFSSTSRGNPFHDLPTQSIALASALAWCGTTVAAVLPSTLATVLYVQTTDAGPIDETFSSPAAPPQAA